MEAFPSSATVEHCEFTLSKNISGMDLDSQFPSAGVSQPTISTSSPTVQKGKDSPIR